MKHLIRSSSVLVACALLTAVGCGQSIHYDTFGIAAPDNDPARIAAVLARLQAAPPARDHAVAYGVGGEPSELFVVDLLTGLQRWSQPAAPRSWPHLAGDVIVSHEGASIIGRDVRTGVQRFAFSDDGMWLVGAAGEGHIGAFTLSSSAGAGAHSQLVIVRGTEIVHRLRATHAMGSPEVAGGMVLVPWGSQYLSFLDATTAEEAARVRVRGSVLGHVFAKGGHVYVGQSDLFRITPSIAAGTSAEAAHYAPPRVDLPGRPGFMLDAYQAPPTTTSAVHRVRMAFRPAGGGEVVRLTDDTLYVLFHRVVFALDAASGVVRWAYLSPRDLAGAEPVPGALFLADVTGAIITLDAQDGSLRREFAGRHAATLMRFHALRLDLRDAAEEEVAVGAQLAAIATDTDTRIAPASQFALRALASLPGDEPTTSLIAICENAGGSPGVQEAACRALSERTEGRTAIVAALGRQGDFVSGTPVPAVGALAAAAARIGATEAVPWLLRHLADPATPDDALQGIVLAVGALGTVEVVPPLLAFVRLYHADTAAPGLRLALEAAINAACEFDAAAALPVLEEVAQDPESGSSLRLRAQHLLERHAAVAAAARRAREIEEAEARAVAAAEVEAELSADAIRNSAPASPPGLTHLTPAVVRDALAPVIPAIHECMAQSVPPVDSVRLVLVVNPTGEWSAVGTTPASLRTCVAPLVRTQTMPRVSSPLRQRVTFLVTR